MSTRRSDSHDLPSWILGVSGGVCSHLKGNSSNFIGQEGSLMSTRRSDSHGLPSFVSDKRGGVCTGLKTLISCHHGSIGFK